MTVLQQVPWIDAAVLLPLIGALWIGRMKSSDTARSLALVFTGFAFVCAVAAGLQFVYGQAPETDLIGRFTGRSLLAIDDSTAPLVPLTALLFALTAVATLRTKVRRFSFAWNLLSEAIVLATLASHNVWAIIALLALGTIPPYWELRARGKPVRAYVLHMALFVGLMIVGQVIVNAEGAREIHSLWAMAPLAIAVFIRSGIAPFHCWTTDLFEHATFGSALLFVTPMMGAYAALRLVLPIAPEGILHSLGWISLFTAVYASGMALVQREARRFFCYIFLSHSALVLVGLVSVEPIALTGALCLWLSVGLSLAGFGLTLRALEARHGRLSLTSYHGAYENKPILAICFFLTGMASVGFPGTFGFLGTELLVDGVVTSYAYVGVLVVIASALNGIAVLKAYFLLFTGRKPETTVPLAVSGRERFAVLTLVVLIIGGGLFPQRTVFSRFQAAEHLLKDREAFAARHARTPVLTDRVAP